MYIHLSVFIKENTELFLAVKLAECKKLYTLFVLVSTTFVISTKQRIAVIPAICSIFGASRAAG